MEVIMAKGDWFLKLMDRIGVGWLVDAFSQNKDSVLRLGLPFIAVMCFIIAIAFVYLAIIKMS